MPEPKPKDAKPQGEAEQEGKGDDKVMVDLRHMPLDELFNKIDEIRGDESVTLGNKEKYTITPNEMLRITAGEHHLERRNAELKKAEEEYAARLKADSEKEAIALLNAMGITKENIEAAKEKDSAKPDAQPDETGKPKETESDDSKPSLREQRLEKELADIKKQLGDRDGKLDTVMSFLNEREFASVAKDFPFLETELIGGEKKPKDLLGWMACQKILESDDKITLREAAEQTKEILEKRRQQDVIAGLKEAVEKGTHAPVAPGKEGVHVDEDWNGEGGVFGLLGSKGKSKSANPLDTILPDDGYSH